jgi:regulator of sirC expression with transglutaminase-like and TPR domain
MVGGSAITLPALHQLHFCALLRRGALHRALDSVSSIITLQPEDPSNIIYPLMVFRRIACEFTEENKALMVTLLGLLFCKPN